MRHKLRKLVCFLFICTAGSWVFADGNPVLEEVVVTATKRTENLQDVPISIGVVSSEFIDKFEISDLGDFQSYVPGLQVQKTFGSWSVRVRGIGSGITNLAFDSSVPVFNDGVYCARGKCMESAFLDVERIEVARGPQGALFGKSTMAGAVSVVSAKPTDELEHYVKAGYEVEDGSYLVSGAFSGPFSDTLRGRLAYNYEQKEGWVSNPFVSGDEPEEDRYAVRAMFEWDATDNTMLTLKLETGDSETTGGSHQLVHPGLMSLLSSDSMPEYRPDDNRRVSTGVGEEDFYDHDWKIATLTLDHHMANGHTIQAIAGYWETDTAWRLDVDGGPDFLLNSDLRDSYEQTTIDLRLLSPTGNELDYIVGAWYQTSELENRQFSPFSNSLAHFFGGVTLGVPPFLLPPESAGGVGTDRGIARDQDAWSVYGQLTWNVTDRFRLIADARYTDETQKATGFAYSSIFPDNVNPVHSGFLYLFHVNDYIFHQKREDDSLDPAIRAQFDLNDDVVLYAGWSSGSKAGGLKANDANIGNYTLAECLDPAWCRTFTGMDTLTPAQMAAGITLQDGNATFDYEDEEAESFEIGAKMILLDGRASLNIAAFSMDFDNLQTSSYDGTRFIINNASSATVDGVELEWNMQVSEYLRVDAAIAYVDATYDDFNQAQCPIGDDLEQTDPSCVDGQADLSGVALERVPEWEANINAHWNYVLKNGLQFMSIVSMYHSDEYTIRQDQSPFSKQDSFTKWDMRVALANAEDTWEVGVTGRNLTDEYTIQHAYEVLGDNFQSLSRGRTITFDAVYRF